VSRHAVNSALALFELLLARTNTPPLIHMLWLVVILALYLCVAYITFATKGFYVYSFLDPATSGKAFVVAYVFGILIGCLIVYGFSWGVIRLRIYITEQLLHMDGKYTKGPSRWRNSAASRDVEMSDQHLQN
jgi:hypothetical protein